MRSRAARWGCALLLLAPAACSGNNPGSGDSPSATNPVAPPVTSPSAPAPTSRWDHVVVVIMSTRSYGDIVGSPDAPFLNLLARSGATFTNAHAVARPAAPNYFALFSGLTYGLAGDSCPHRFNNPNLATQLVAKDLFFTSYAEGLSAPKSRACHLRPYTTAHNPPASFTNVPTSMIAKAKAFGPDYTALPAVSFVIPDHDDSMAESDVRTGDTWLRQEVTGYAAWATSHRSLLVITWDQAALGDADNHIPMIAIGSGVPVGPVAQRVDHYSLLATIQDAFGLSRLGNTLGIDAIAALGG